MRVLIKAPDIISQRNNAWCFNMLKRIASKESPIEQARRLKACKFKPGFDNMIPDTDLMWIEINSKRLTDDILNSRYNPMPAVGFYVVKKNGSYRKLVKLTVLDTIVIYRPESSKYIQRE